MSEVGLVPEVGEDEAGKARDWQTHASSQSDSSKIGRAQNHTMKR